MSPKASALLAYLSAHIGADKGVTCKQIAAFIGWNERDVRTFVSELRDEGHAVCGHPRTGYFIAESPEELERSCNFLRMRALHSLGLEARLRKISLPALLGQLNLNT